MKSSVLCKRLTGLRLLFIILRSCHVLPNPPTKNEGRRHLMKPTFCCSLSLPSLWSPWRRGCDRSWVEWSFRSGKQSHQWIHSPAREQDEWKLNRRKWDEWSLTRWVKMECLPWKRKSWRWNRGVGGCRWLWPGESVAGTCASSWQWSGGAKWVRFVYWQESNKTRLRPSW